MAIPSSKKDLSVETLRGVAIILVVMGHVIGDDADGGMKVADDTLFRYFYYTFEYLRMPLFTVISGWVYALRPAKSTNLADFTIKKVRRIILPMIFVCTSYFLLQYFTPGTNMKGNLLEIWKIYVFPYTLFWYLPSLFLVFTAVSIADSKNCMNTFVKWILVYATALILYILRDVFISERFLNIFSFKGALYLLPYFILGIGIQRYKDFFKNKYFLLIIFAFLITAITLHQLTWFKVINLPLGRNSLIAIIIGITGCIILFRLKWNVRFFIWFGSFAYSIYLFHAFGTAAGRILISKFGITHHYAIFFFSLFVGLAIPIIADFILDKNKLTRMLFLGRPFNKSEKE